MDGNEISRAAHARSCMAATPRRTIPSQDWWPKSLNLDILSQHDRKTDPLGPTSTIARNSRRWILRH